MGKQAAMKCQICHKNEAQIVFTQIVNNEKVVMQICTECAKKKGLSIEFEAVEPLTPESTNFLSALTDNVEDEDNEQVPDLSCEVCGLTYAEFKKSGLFGCDMCHVAFGDHTREILKQIHGVSLHEGKVAEPLPVKTDMKHQLKKLRAELKHCVEMEEYEKAAELRDKIEEIQKGISSQ